MTGNLPTRSLRSRLLLAALLLPLLLVGCAATVTDREVPGTYLATPPWGTSTLLLTPDHTFLQTVRLRDGGVKQLRGTWSLNQSTGQPTYTTIQLSPFFNVTHDKQGVYSVGSVYSIYRVPLSGINIAADPEFGIAHRRQ